MTALRNGILAMAVVPWLAACGSDPNDRVASGTGLGALTGAGIGLAFGGFGAIPGALIGAGLGAGGGAATDAEDIDLGEPVWY